MSAQERDIVAAANVGIFAGMGDCTGEVQAAMRDVVMVGLTGPSRMQQNTLYHGESDHEKYIVLQKNINHLCGCANVD
jgi:hypothetical protein